MPCARASAQVMRPFPLSSHCATSAGNSTGLSLNASVLVTRTSSRTSVSDVQESNTRSNASASRRSIVKLYLRRMRTTRSANQQRFHAWTRKRDSQRVTCETSLCRAVRRAEPAVVCFRPCHDMFDIGLPSVAKGLTGIRTPDITEAVDDLQFNGLRIRIVR